MPMLQDIRAPSMRGIDRLVLTPTEIYLLDQLIADRGATKDRKQALPLPHQTCASWRIHGLRQRPSTWKYGHVARPYNACE